MQKLILLFCAALLMGSGTTAELVAQEKPQHEARCLLIGPLAISSYLDFVRGVADKKRYVVGSRADRATDLIELYKTIGCDMTALNKTIECLSASLLEPENRTPVAERAEACMTEAGMPVR